MKTGPLRVGESEESMFKYFDVFTAMGLHGFAVVKTCVRVCVRARVLPPSACTAIVWRQGISIFSLDLLGFSPPESQRLESFGDGAPNAWICLVDLFRSIEIKAQMLFRCANAPEPNFRLQSAIGNRSRRVSSWIFATAPANFGLHVIAVTCRWLFFLSSTTFDTEMGQDWWKNRRFHKFCWGEKLLNRWSLESQQRDGGHIYTNK